MFSLVIHNDLLGAGSAIDRMASRLRGRGPARIHKGHHGCAAATVAGTLPEDIFDRQPYVDEALIFVSRVRLDNRTELAVALGRSGEDLAVMPDSLLLREAYGRWGKDCVHHATGDFAFAALHRRERRLVAAVDHRGAARLYYARTGSGLAVSGEMRAILAHPAVSADPDYRSLARVLDAGIDRSSTPYLAVRALPGGHYLQWDEDHDFAITRWWQPETRAKTVFQVPDDYASCATELLTRAVSSRMRSSSGISTTLSGGLDSGLVTAIAAQRAAARGQQITVYTAVPEHGLPMELMPNWEADDSPFAAELVSCHANLRHVLVPPQGRSSIDVLADLFREERVPMKSLSNLTWIDAISREAADAEAPVVLNGGHGNATISFSGGGALAELLGTGQFGAAARHGRDMGAATNRPLWRVVASEIAQSLRHGVAQRGQGSALGFVRPAHRPSPNLREGAFAAHDNRRAAWIAFAMAGVSVWSPDPLTYRGAEWRDPTSDRRLMEALLTFPLFAFAPAGVPRGLARMMGRGLLPNSIRLRTTRGAQVPELPALIGRDTLRYADMIGRMEKSDACNALLDPGLMRAALGRISGGDLDLERAAGFERAFGVAHFLLSLEEDAA